MNHCSMCVCLVFGWQVNIMDINAYSMCVCLVFGWQVNIMDINQGWDSSADRRISAQAILISSFPELRFHGYEKSCWKKSPKLYPQSVSTINGAVWIGTVWANRERKLRCSETIFQNGRTRAVKSFMKKREELLEVGMDREEDSGWKCWSFHQES